MEFQKDADANVIARRRDRAVEAWGPIQDIILVGAGMPISIPGGADQTFPFSTHPEYYWLTGRQREGGVLAFDPKYGWTLFEPALSESEQVWGGSEAPIGRPVTELEDWMKERQGRSFKWLGVARDSEADTDLRAKLLHARRPKDVIELEWMEAAARATAAGHAVARDRVKVGATEREIQIEIEAAFFRAGADTTGYGTIVGSGPNSTMLHSIPGERKLKEGDFVVVDAGGAVHGYTADVTRTLAASGKWTSDQQAIYDAVLRAEERVIDAIHIGVEWSEMHILAATNLAESLNKMGVIRCSAQEAIESELIALFFPHGVGHMVGLGVRDAGGPYPGRDGKQKFAGVSIRMDLPLGEGYIVTVEPGLYFNRVLLRDPNRREKFKDVVDWKMIEPWIGNAGVRIEDNILVTKSGALNLTRDIPK